MFTFTLQGKTYNSELSGNTVAEYLRNNFTSDFVRSMLSARERFGRWTERQAMWCHKLVIDMMESNQSKQAESITTNMSGISFPQLLSFLSRPVKLKRIKLTFQHNDGEVGIKKASTDEKGFWITKDGKLVGQLKRDGQLVDKGISPDVACLLDELEANPESVAAEHGKKTGCCCFCSLPLTDERSTKAGYGPICAGHYGLKWGE